MTATTQGAHHVGLTVPDLAASTAFFLDTLGFSKVGEKPEYPAAFVSDGSLMITLWQAENPAEAVPFDRRNVIGLHHLALKVDGADALNALHGKLVDCEGVDVEFAPEPLGSGGTRHMMCSIPGGSRPSLSCERTTTCCSRSPCEALFTARSRRMSGLRMLRVIGTAMAILRKGADNIAHLCQSPISISWHPWNRVFS